MNRLEWMYSLFRQRRTPLHGLQTTELMWSVRCQGKPVTAYDCFVPHRHTRIRTQIKGKTLAQNSTTRFSVFAQALLLHKLSQKTIDPNEA